MAKRSNSTPSKRPGKRRDVAIAVPKTFVVGVGASAGGLQVLQTFFGAFKTVPPAAFVVVQHLSPDFKSFMVELLTKHTRMKVQRAEHNARVEPGSCSIASGPARAQPPRPASTACAAWRAVNCSTSSTITRPRSAQAPGSSELHIVPVESPDRGLAVAHFNITPAPPGKVAPAGRIPIPL